MKFIKLIVLLWISISCIESTAQSRLSIGPKIGVQFSYAVYWEFYEPYPFNRFDKNGGVNYGRTDDQPRMLFGTFIQYALSSSERVHLSSEFLFSQRAYSQSQSAPNSKIKYIKDYFDIPISFKFKVFRNPKNGIFLESGVVQSFILSEQTDFSNPIDASDEYNGRRSRANEREVNLFAFRGGAGYKFRAVDAAVYFQRDKHYSYLNGGVRYHIKL